MIRTVTRSLVSAFLISSLCFLSVDHAYSAVTTGSSIRKLTEQQYRNTIADILGEEIEIKGRFEPELRAEGLLALGTAVVSVTPSGFEQFDQMAQGIAEQFVNKLKETPALCGDTELTKACASKAIQDFGGRLFRRPLTSVEEQLFINLMQQIAEIEGELRAGLEAAFAGILISPPFLFRLEETEADPNSVNSTRLTAYTMAQRLSYFLWNTAPDDALFKAAQTNALHSKEELSKQIERMLASPSLEQGVRALFVDMLMFDEFDVLSKDPEIFSRFNFKTAADAQEETLKVVINHLLAKNADYRELFTTRETFLTNNLGVLYQVPIASREGWNAYTFPEEPEVRGRPRAGLLTHASFLALHSHPGRSSVTLRGQAVRELFLCQIVPAPPPNVNFSIVQDTGSMLHKTGRERVLAHQDDPACAGCHQITDNIGLALENYDGSGLYRATENGAAIDSSGHLDGDMFEDAIGLGEAVARHPATTECLVRRTLETALGRTLTIDDRPWNKSINANFSNAGYSFRSLLRDITTSATFFSSTEGTVELADR